MNKTDIEIKVLQEMLAQLLEHRKEITGQEFNWKGANEYEITGLLAPAIAERSRIGYALVYTCPECDHAVGLKEHGLRCPVCGKLMLKEVNFEVRLCVGINRNLPVSINSEKDIPGYVIEDIHREAAEKLSAMLKAGKVEDQTQMVILETLTSLKEK
ncbi:MAG: hypothetical protein RBS96_02330 [Dehalococcoidales bacterium]|jgi:DNA-directed RNA polymerase subunit RPC12/RpoP|nr:hypothetical protein [Dehalococcoidales bacterium]